VIEEMSEPSFTIRVPSQPWASKAVRELTVAFAEGFGATVDDLAIFTTALGEALANAIEHSGTRAPIEVTCSASRRRIVATVRDFGAGLAPDVEPNAEVPDACTERGRGLPIMRSCSDIFSIDSTPGVGTAVVVGRYLRAAGSGNGRPPTRHRRPPP
jgi:serine/threonine-protein kinase RsbW